MTASESDDLGRLVADLVRTLRQLEAEFEPRTEHGTPRPPSPRELLRFTSDVAIPGAILILRTNVEALKLLQRALRMADGRSPGGSTNAGEVRDRAERVGVASLSKLDGALADLQDAVEGRPEDDDARALLADARELRDEIEARLDERTDGAVESTASSGRDGASGPADVPVDVDAELESIKEEFDDGAGGDADAANGDDSTTGDQTGDDSADGGPTDDDSTGRGGTTGGSSPDGDGPDADR